MSQPGTNASQTKNTTFNVRTETDMTLVGFMEVLMKDVRRALVEFWQDYVSSIVMP
jgi:hypothetical protein